MAAVDYIVVAAVAVTVSAVVRPDVQSQHGLLSQSTSPTVGAGKKSVRSGSRQIFAAPVHGPVMYQVFPHTLDQYLLSRYRVPPVPPPAPPPHTLHFHATHNPEPEDRPPVCSAGNPKMWCVEDPEYPVLEIEQALHHHQDRVLAIYREMLWVSTQQSVDPLKDFLQRTYNCPSESTDISPLRAVNKDGRWRVVVNGVHFQHKILEQTVHIEECTTGGEDCDRVPERYLIKCKLENINHRFLVYNKYDDFFPFAVETFRLPSSAASVARLNNWRGDPVNAVRAPLTG